VTPQNAGALAEVCRRLGGIPLAIELAAARMGALSVEQILGRLNDSLRLLTGGARTAVPRQRTLRATLDWSHELLSGDERVLFRRLSTFAGGWTLEAAETVGAGGGIDEEDALEVLSKLVDKSLVVAEMRAADVVVRYRMLEPIRHYARERLEEVGEADTVRRRHASFFLALAEEAEPALRGAQQQAWADRLEAEHDNLRAALGWSLEKEPETTLRLAGKLARFWEIRSHFLEGSGWLEASLRHSGRVEAATDVATRANLLSEAGTFAFHRADFERAIELHGEALELYRELGDDSGVAFALLCLGAQYSEQGDHERAAPFLEEALSLSREVGDKRTIVHALHNLAEVERQRGDYERAKTLGMQSVSLAREVEDKWMLGICVGWVGMLAVWSGEEHDDLAEGFLKEGLALDREIGNWGYGAYCLEGFAGLAGAKGQGARAARLWGAAEALRSNIGAPLPPEPRPYYERSMAAARARLEEGTWEAAWKQGMAMSLEEAVEYALFSREEPALDPTSPDPQQSQAGEAPSELTRREQEVMVLVSRGLTDRQISTRLGISERTASNHVAKILRKLGLSSRTQLASWATERATER
jgi:DNA-binding CsgD family transcriptional regulator/tetratricopeptide (TPR) repeat protein